MLDLMEFMYYANQNIAKYGSRGLVDNAVFYISFRLYCGFHPLAVAALHLTNSGFAFAMETT